MGFVNSIILTNISLSLFAFVFDFFVLNSMLDYFVFIFVFDFLDALASLLKTTFKINSLITVFKVLLNKVLQSITD